MQNELPGGGDRPFSTPRRIWVEASINGALARMADDPNFDRRAQARAEQARIERERDRALLPWTVLTKIDRGDQLFAEVDELILAWKRRVPRPLVTQRWDADTSHVVFELPGCSLPPAELAAIFNDGIHSYRTALDQMATVTAGRLEGVSKKQYFPVIDGHRAGGPTFAEKIANKWVVRDARMIEIVENVQPYRARPDRPKASALAILSLHDNADKHEFLRPTTAVPLPFDNTHLTMDGNGFHDPRSWSNLIYPDDPPATWNPRWAYPEFGIVQDVATIDELVVPSDEHGRGEIMRVKITPSGPSPLLSRGDGFQGLSVTFGPRAAPLDLDRVTWIRRTVWDTLCQLAERLHEIAPNKEVLAGDKNE